MKSIYHHFVVEISTTFSRLTFVCVRNTFVVKVMTNK